MASLLETVRRSFNVSVVGLSGGEKGCQGVGKSCLCNRFLYSDADKFRSDHISEISQSDFIGRVVNSRHFLYWGEVVKHMENGQTALFRVIEQTEFSDCDSLQPFLFASDQSYVKRAVSVNLQSRDKLCYMNKEQMALPDEFEMLLFPEKFDVDGFIVVFDGSGHVDERSKDAQEDLLKKLIPALVKTKRPVVVGAAKCEQGHQQSLRDMKALTEKLLKNPHFIETSAFEDINVDGLFFALAHLIERGRCRVMPFETARRLKQQQLADAKEAYQTLLNEKISDFQTAWSQGQNSLKDEVAFKHYVQLCGMDTSISIFSQHTAKLKDKKKESKQSEHLTRINSALDVLLPNVKEDSTWLECQKEMETLQEFNQYFVSLENDDDWLVTRDSRIPLSILGLPQAAICFDTHKDRVLKRQKRLEKKHYCRDMISKAKDSILPGMTWIEVSQELSLRDNYTSIEEELGEFVWTEMEKKFRQDSMEDFNELLIESPTLFDFPQTTDGSQQMNSIRNALKDDARYQRLQRLDNCRLLLILKHMAFLQKEPSVDVRFRNIIDSTHSSIWNVKAGDFQLRLLLLGTDGLAQELEGNISELCSPHFQCVIDDASYGIELRVIDNEIVSVNNFASEDFTPTGCICIFSNHKNLQYVFKALEGNILASKSNTQISHPPFRGLPITLIQAIGPDTVEADPLKIAEDAAK